MMHTHTVVKAPFCHIEFGISATCSRATLRLIHQMKVGTMASAMHSSAMLSVPKLSVDECVVIALCVRLVSFYIVHMTQEDTRAIETAGTNLTYAST